jgi:membrane protease YdiL (CAAX protease family)
MSTPTPQPPLGGPPATAPLGEPASADSAGYPHAPDGSESTERALTEREPEERGPEHRYVPRAAGRTPLVGWPWWTAFAALLGAYVLAVFGGLIVDIPAALLGVHITSTTNLPPGLELADTAVQDAAFVAAAVLFAHVGVRTVRAWQFGLRPPRVPWRRALLAIPVTYLAFFAFDLIWAELLRVNEKEKLLETLGANEGVALLVLSAALTCVMAPICEEFLFRGFFFRALSNLRGSLPAAVVTGLVFGLVHVGSAPAVDLPPLAFLGFALCMLYRATGSLYPCIVVHSLNNCIAFASLEGWSVGQGVLLVIAVGATLLVLATGLRSAGVIGDEPVGATPPTASVG